MVSQISCNNESTNFSRNWANSLLHLLFTEIFCTEGYRNFCREASVQKFLWKADETSYDKYIMYIVYIHTCWYIHSSYLLMRQWQCSFRVEWDFLDSENYGSLTSPAISKKSIHPEYGCFQDSKWPFKLCSLVVHHLTSSPILFLISHYICLVF